MIPAIRENFVGATIKGCVFHYTKCIYGKIKKWALQNAYKNDAKFREASTRIFGLALANPDHITDAFADISASLIASQSKFYFTSDFSEGGLGCGSSTNRSGPDFFHVLLREGPNPEGS